MEARMKRIDARISCSPLGPCHGKWGERIQSRSGIMTIRLIVMEFGRFNLNSLKSVNDLLVPCSDRQLLKNCGKAFGPHRPAT
jgi:hypothetical protein